MYFAVIYIALSHVHLKKILLQIGCGTWASHLESSSLLETKKITHTWQKMRVKWGNMYENILGKNELGCQNANDLSLGWAPRGLENDLGIIVFGSLPTAWPSARCRDIAE